jgi:hypothetical protein
MHAIVDAWTCLKASQKGFQRQPSTAQQPNLYPEPNAYGATVAAGHHFVDNQVCLGKARRATDLAHGVLMHIWYVAHVAIVATLCTTPVHGR